jgi:hypothetical protein
MTEFLHRKFLKCNQLLSNCIGLYISSPQHRFAESAPSMLRSKFTLLRSWCWMQSFQRATKIDTAPDTFTEIWGRPYLRASPLQTVTKRLDTHLSTGIYYELHEFKHRKCMHISFYHRMRASCWVRWHHVDRLSASCMHKTIAGRHVLYYSQQTT